MKILVTGGAGFIGSNLAHFYLSQGADVRVLDNLSRAGVRANLDWLRAQHGSRLDFVEGDIRDFPTVERAVAGRSVVLHTAAQVAVTTSVTNPRQDFEINALGAFNVLEAARALPVKPIVMFTSTNKVYGGLEDATIIELPTRYDLATHPEGIDEHHPLDFHSPYGCSKGTADQYVRDYARIYDLPTVVFRMSCIYGTRQFGNEDQGWVVHFLRSGLFGQKLTLYGDGKQVRDVLFIDDLVQAFDLARAAIDRTRGQVYNIGGGRANSLSVWHEFNPLIRELTGNELNADRQGWRPGDQLYYVSDTRKASRDFGWSPRHSPREGLGRVLAWLRESRPA